MTERRKRFAEGTDVPSSKSKTELDLLLERHGAEQRGIFEEAGRGVVIFKLQNRHLRLTIALPKAEEFPVAGSEPRGWYGWDVKRRQVWAKAQTEQGTREAWRRLLLVTKAKLELVADSAGNIESEFLANVVLPDGRTVHEALETQLAHSYDTGQMPPLLPGKSVT